MKLVVLLLSVFMLTACGTENITRIETVDVPVGDEECPLGGTKSTEYVDSNGNGHLDDNEIRGTSVYTCEEDDIVTTQ